MEIFFAGRGSVARSLSLTAGFSRVLDSHATGNRFHGFERAGQTVETVHRSFERQPPD
jgi:hypothetical protein